MHKLQGFVNTLSDNIKFSKKISSIPQSGGFFLITGKLIRKASNAALEILGTVESIKEFWTNAKKQWDKRYYKSN